MKYDEESTMDKKTEKLTPDLQTRFLSKLCSDHTRVCIYLTKGTRLAGYIKAFDTYVLYLEEPCQQIVYKSSICSIGSMLEHNNRKKDAAVLEYATERGDKKHD